MSELNMLKECPNRDANLENCPCENEDCSHRGICCECVASHRAKGNKPMCMR